MRFLTKILTNMHSNAFPAFAEGVAIGRSRFLSMHAAAGMSGYIIGERGGKRFGPFECGRD
jgi:hypothetical protein